MMSAADTARQSIGVSGGRIGVIAGGGILPIAVVRTLRERAANPFVVLIKGEVENPANFNGADCVSMALEDFALLVPRLKQAGVTHLVMAGSVARRPRLRAMRWTFSLLKLIPHIAAAIRRGDDGLLRTVINIMEANGIRIVGAHEVVPDLLAPEGQLGQCAPTAGDRRDIKAASEAALAIGRLDIGQAAVAIGGRVIALEGIEGTEGLLERTAALRTHGRLAEKKRGVLVKCCKPQQEMRADLPSIGPDTINQAHEAGLAGVIVDAGQSFILDFGATVARADEYGLFLLGQKPAGDKK